MREAELRDVLSNLRVARDARGRKAAHKPLLVLLLLQRFRLLGSTDVSFEEIAPHLATLIDRVSPNEGSSPRLDRAALPFVHLERSIWRPRFDDGDELTPNGRRDAAYLIGRGARGAMPLAVEEALGDGERTATLARLVLDTYIDAAEHDALWDELVVDTTPAVNRWDVTPGTRLDRPTIARRFGGSTYGGIQPSAKTPNIFLFSDPPAGRKNGYIFDGWTPDGQVYMYTGEGQTGPQKLRAGNLAIHDHRQTGRALRLFIAEGTKPGSQAKIQSYVGEFEIDTDHPYVTEEAKDALGDDRTVLVFRLRPKGHVYNRDVDASQSGDIRREAHVVPILSEAHRVLAYQTSPTEEGTATKREAELVLRYEAHLTKLGHKPCRFSIRPPGALRDLKTDTYDETAHELYEAKAAPTRGALRTAIGQLFDYRRHLPRPDELTLSVLTEARPSDDLVALLRSLNIDCVHETKSGQFTRIRA